MPSFIYRISCLLIFFTFLFVSYSKYNGWDINQYFFNVLINSCIREKIIFLQNLFSSGSFWYFFIVYGTIPLVFLCICITFRSLSKKIEKTFKIAFLLLIIEIFLYNSFFVNENPSLMDNTLYSIKKISSDNDLTIVFILGESTRGDHFHLNGYHRQTTPLLEKIAPISFKQAHSSRLDTIANFKTLMSNYDSKKSFFDFPHRKSIFYFLDKLNFKTALFSTNDISNTYNLYKDDLKNTSQKIFFGFDEKLLPLLTDFQKKYAGHNQFIMLHTYAGHHNYDLTVPKAKKVFSEIHSDKRINSSGCNCSWSLNGKLLDEVINDYDNTIIYTDYFLSEVIKNLKDKNAFLIYTSDHGESFGEQGQTCLHCFSEKEVWHVPFIVWASDIWKQKHPSEWQKIEQALNQEVQGIRNISHRNVIASILNCNGIETDYINPKMSLCETNFEPDFFQECNRFEKHDCPVCNLNKNNLPRFPLHISTTEVKPSTISKICPFDQLKYKTFLHAVNTPEKLLSHSFEFSNLEIDIFYKNGQIWTGHEVGKSTYLLRDILSMLPDPKAYTLWLDLKNLTEKNKESILEALTNLLQHYKIKAEHILIESPNIENLKIFENAGFGTSFYFSDLPADKIAIKQRIESDINRFEESNPTYISADVKYSDYIQTFFPKACHLFWNVPEEQSQYILTAPQTKAIISTR